MGTVLQNNRGILMPVGVPCPAGATSGAACPALPVTSLLRHVGLRASSVTQPHWVRAGTACHAGAGHRLRPAAHPCHSPLASPFCDSVPLA